jgi:Flp pilus assembly protein TadB
MIFLIPVIGLLCTTLVLFWLYPNQVKTGKLSDLYSADSVRTLAGLDPKSLDYKLLAAGLKLRPVTFRLLCGAAGLAGLAVMWVFLPGLPAMVVGGIAFYVPNAWLDDKVKSRGRMIDQQLPIAIGRISAGLLAGGSVPDVLQQVGESLALEKNNPLTPELILTATEMRVKDRLDALHSLAARSPSVSLANLAQLLEGFTEAGGRSYTQVLMDISTRVQQILMARNRAQAKAGDSLVSAKVLPAVLGLILAYLSSDPMVRESLTQLPVQIVIGLAMGAMVAGYLIIRSMIMEAV